MPTTLPFGIRVAAGLVGTSFDRLVKLPGELPGLTVSFAGQLLRTSMRVRQEVAELATRGDELLAPLVGGAEEHPAWATFDEDEDENQVAPASSATTGDTAGAARAADNMSENTADFTDLADDAAAQVDELVFSSTSEAFDSPILGDHRLTVAELKDRLPDLDVAAVTDLLAQEEAGPNRAPYLTLLTNRLTTLQHENR